MTFEQLHYFLEIAKDMNFTKTANRLYISQSTLSRQISALESSLSAQLLVRDTRSVEFTEAGRLLVQEGPKLLSHKQELEERIFRVSEALTGKISISTFSMQNNSVFQFCYRFQLRYPDVMLNLINQVYGTTVEQLEENQTDVCVGMSSELDSAPPDIEWVSLWKGEYRLIADYNSPLANKEFVTPEDVSGVNLLTARKPAGSKACINLHRQLGMDMERHVSFNQPETLEDLILQVKAGLGVALLPDMLCRSNEGYKAIPLQGVDSGFNIIMAWRKDSLNPNMEKFKEMLYEALDEGFFQKEEHINAD